MSVSPDDGSDFNRRIIDEFRANEGRVGGPFEGAPMVLLHHIGAKSGTERINPLIYLPDGHRIVVFASKGGAATNPDWFHNLVAHPRVLVEIATSSGVETVTVEAIEVTGTERDKLFARQVEARPAFGDYEQRAQGVRTIPVVALTQADHHRPLGFSLLTDMPTEGASPADPQLRTELLQRAEYDKQARSALVHIWPAIDPDDAAQLQAMDEDNAIWLRQALSVHGWPTTSLAGTDGAQAAWLLAQHADHDRDLQRTCLSALSQAITHGDADPAHFAYLDDRIHVAEGLPQRYGTQYISTDDGIAPSPIEDPDLLDQRRAELGLTPFADYDAQIQATYGHLARRDG